MKDDRGSPETYSGLTISSVRRFFVSLCTASDALNGSLFRHGLGGGDRIVYSLFPLFTRKHVSDRYTILFFVLVLRVICNEATPQATAAIEWAWVSTDLGCQNQGDFKHSTDRVRL